MTRKSFSTKRRVLSSAICALTLTLGMGKLAVANTDDAASFPQRAITLVDGFPPGGSTDALARLVGQHLGEALGQSIVIENRSGAGGIVATSHVARAVPDGYTILLGTIGPIVVSPHIMKDMAYDPQKDLEPVISLVDVANVMVVRSEHKAETLQELIDMAKEKPHELDFGSSGIGTTGHLAGEIFQQQADVQMTHVPYRGGAPAMTGLLGGETDMIFSSVPTAVEHVKTGRLRALAVTGHSELETWPGVAPLKDLGLTNYELPSWYGVFAPAGTPRPIIEKLEKAFTTVLERPDVKQQLIALGMVPSPVLSAEFKQQLANDWGYWKEVLEKSGIELN